MFRFCERRAGDVGGTIDDIAQPLKCANSYVHKNSITLKDDLFLLSYWDHLAIEGYTEKEK